jgi:regulator of protease activity HflC (stomatin/prohibitin superfamily)
MTEIAYGIIAALVIAYIGYKSFKWLVGSVVIFEYECGVKYSKGHFKAILPEGMYWFVPYVTTIQKVDMRPRCESITGQEVLSADGVTLKVSLVAKYQVIDPHVAVNRIENYQEALYLELQLGLREVIGGAEIDDVLAKRGELSAKLMELKKDKAETFGLSLLSVDIKDIMFPGDLKKIFAQVVKARKEGMAALEKARAETATLRHLANAAAVVDKNPLLMQLRLLQALGESAGNTVVLGMPAQATPLPVKTKEIKSVGEPPEPQDEEP